MRLIPSKRLILWSGLLLPFTLFIGIYPFILQLALIWLLFISSLSVIDSLISSGLIRKIYIELPEALFLIQSRPKDVLVTIKNDHKKEVNIRMAFDADSSMVFDPYEVSKKVPGTTQIDLNITLDASERGTKHIEAICIEARSRFGFWLIRDKIKKECQVKVYPNIFQDNQRLAASLLLKSEYGLRSQRMIGHGREFEKLREYLPDDNFSDIAWKATAKKGKPVTKVFQIERTQQIFIALDYSRTSLFAYGQRSNLDIAIESVLLMQLCCEREGDMLGLITFADKVSGYCPAGKGKIHFGTLRNIVHDLTPKHVTPDFENLFIFIKQYIKKRALILLFTNLEDLALSSILFKDIDIINHTHLLTLCTFNGYENKLLFCKEDTAELIQIYERLAAQLSNNEQERLISRLKKQNVDMLRFSPKRFSMGIIGHYLEIKRRQIL